MWEAKKNKDWTEVELAAIVRCYLDMLALELAGQHYNKTVFRDLLFQQLQEQRSKGAIEFKHCNISAAMSLLGYPSIQGYKPRNNFQKSLVDAIALQLLQHSALATITQAAVAQPAQAPVLHDFEHVLQPFAPAPQQVREDIAHYVARHPVRRDYLVQEAHNRSLGLAGERFVVAYERWKLQRHGLPGLAKKVEHVALTQGDGLGFDVRSYDTQGQEQWIEVKTTSFAKETPFFISSNELKVSQSAPNHYHLYRLYSFRKRPQFYALHGDIAQHCTLDPITFRASIAP